MSRPNIAIRTAVIGARFYRRNRDLPLAVPGLQSCPKEVIVERLTQEEQKWERRRLNNSPRYNPTKHILTMAALFAETETK